MSERLEDRLFDRAIDQHGYVTTTDARALGINPVELAKLADRGRILHEGHGVYRFEKFPTASLAPMMAAVLWTSRAGVLSHDTALELHELCDINPDKIHLTIPGRRPRRPGGELIVTHHGRFAPGDVSELAGIPIVRPAVAIAQGIESGVRSGLIRDAIGNARRTGRLTEAEETALHEQLQRAER